MPVYWKLDKILTQGNTYQTPPDIGYIIRKIGTDGASDTKLVIDGKSTGAILSEFAPLHKTSSNLLGPLDLGELYYVIPPDKKFWVEGPSGAKLRIIGDIVKLLPGEAFPGDLLSRYNEQFDKYLTYLKGSTSLGTDVAWTAGVEHEVLSATPRTIERYTLAYPVMAKVENASATITEGQVGVRFYLDDAPLDVLTGDPGHKGVDLLSMPYPPSDTTEEEPFTLATHPIVVPGDHTLSIRMINNSGANITPSTGTSLTLTVLAIVLYERARS